MRVVCRPYIKHAVAVTAQEDESVTSFQWIEKLLHYYIG